MTGSPPDVDAAGRGRIDQADGGQEGGFAGTAGAEECHDLAPADGSETSRIATTSVLPLP